MTGKWIKFGMVVFLFGASAVSVTACNTMEGLGQDTKAAGEAISNVSRNSRGY